jgi:hypothetical protein
MIWVNITFILTLIALAFIPKKGKIFIIWIIILIANIGIRSYLIYENDKKSKKISDLETIIENEKDKIRSFDSSIELILEGQWKKERTPDKRKRISPTDNEYYLVLETISEDNHKISFYSTERFSYKLDEGNKFRTPYLVF